MLCAVAHTDYVRCDAPRQMAQLGHDIAPQAGRCTIAVQKHNRAACSYLDIGHVLTVHVDEFLVHGVPLRLALRRRTGFINEKRARKGPFPVVIATDVSVGRCHLFHHVRLADDCTIGPVTTLNFVEHIQSFGDFTDNRVLAVQEKPGCEHDEKLAVGAVRIL